jgi:hypothetical protein
MDNTEQIDRLAEMAGSNGGEPPQPQEIKLKRTTGVTARLEAGTVSVRNSDRVELFRFNAAAAPFSEEAIFFLLEIYLIGFTRGKLIGREIAKARIREVLGDEI